MGGGLGPHRASWDPKDSGRQPGPTCLHRSCPGVEVEHGPQLMGSLVALCLPNLTAGQAGSLNGVQERMAWVACGPLDGALGRGHGQVPAFAIGDIRHLGFGLLVSCSLPALTVQVRGHPQSLLVSEYFVAEETFVWGQALPYRVPGPSLSRGGTWEGCVWRGRPDFTPYLPTHSHCELPASCGSLPGCLLATQFQGPSDPT